MGVVLTALCAVCAVLLAPYALRLWRHFREVVRAMYLTRNVPGPPSLPLLGCVPTFLGVWTDMHGTMHRLLQSYGTTFRMQVLDRVTLVVMDPDDVQAVCTHPALANKAKPYKLLENHLGSGLINMNGPAYKRHRKAITPSLHLDILQDFVPVFAKNAEALARRLRQHADSGAPFNSSPEFGMLTNMTIMETVMSMGNEGASENEYVDMANVLDEASTLIMWRAMRPWWENDAVFTLCSRYKAYNETASTMNEMVTRILHTKSAEVSRGDPAPPRRRMAFLDHVLRSSEGANMSGDELRDELKTFLFAGSTTSMDFLSLVALALTMFPDIQSRVQQEVDEVFGAPGTEGADRPMVSEDLGHLQYTERVLREVLRYAPPVPLMFRSAAEDVKLPSGTLVPRGCMVCLVPAGTHRIPEHFPDPLRFDPDRFLPEQSRGRHPFAYIPFSAGTRNCVGQRYALMFSKTIVATLVRRFTFVRAPGGPKDFGEVSVVPGITISVRGGAVVCVQHRVQHRQRAAA
ncbi:Cytochrome P450 CYP4 [Frankliniella occidentalis]|uniref:Cytochrome P450 4C1-like n=1 Tax=Frankliniella occidentalis TaxID=133901 RepID=A0A6J1SUX6_FRAOC|nr:cytochrome P450 4C1-like [Frankliniella occidentalis]XP_052122211.1 cytochrome P450 4C1-like [Frankliniella occidentalis]XP_052122212.1 cytochrome P450 4C1-like [Frankliniella occidentalis]KAE8748325.1 Cytochrome P450 CYP4 [Frankliniella occidentalis]